jgi:hypothetical protein
MQTAALLEQTVRDAVALASKISTAAKTHGRQDRPDPPLGCNR